MCTTEEKQRLVHTINSLSPTEHNEIFKMLKQSQYTYTKNKNGVFFNLSNIDDADFKALDDFVTFCKENRANFDLYDIAYKECKDSYKTVVVDNDLVEAETARGRISNDEREAIAKIEQDIIALRKDKIAKKITAHGKYAAAKKKFAKRENKRVDSDVQNDLNVEPYIINNWTN